MTTPTNRWWKGHSALLVFLSLPWTMVVSWIPLASKPSIGNRLIVPQLFSSADDSESTEPQPEDFVGKTIYKRTLYSLSPDSQAELQNAFKIEERVRFVSDDENPEFILPVGPRTLILREGSKDGTKITDELFRIDCLPLSTKPGSNSHNGPGLMDTEIATILYLASNPKWIQGDVLELSCGETPSAEGVVGLLSCVASRLAQMGSDELAAYKRWYQQPQEQEQGDGSEASEEDAKFPGSAKTADLEDVFPPRVRQLVLSDESPDKLSKISQLVRNLSSSDMRNKVAIRQLEWSYPGYKRRYDRQFRTILGSDLRLPVPTAKELAKLVANSLLPSNEFAVSSSRQGAETSPSFGAMGMDKGPATVSHQKEDTSKLIDPKIPASFALLCPEYRDELRYLRQFMESGFRMNVRTHYVKMEGIEIAFQTLPKDAPESDLDGLDTMEVEGVSRTNYQSLTAIHHPDYGGDGTAEYFFPFYTGDYDAGLEPLRQVDPRDSRF